MKASKRKKELAKNIKGMTVLPQGGLEYVAEKNKGN